MKIFSEKQAFQIMCNYLRTGFQDIPMMPVAVVLGELNWRIWNPATPIDAAIIPLWETLVKKFSFENSSNRKNEKAIITSEQAYRAMSYFLEFFYEKNAEMEISDIFEEMEGSNILETHKIWHQAILQSLSEPKQVHGL